jgi:predicted porin
LTSSANFDRRTTVNGYAMIGTVKVGAGVIDRKTAAATGVVESDLVYLGVSVPVAGLLTLDAQVARKNVKGSPDDTNMAVARLTYALSKRSAIYAGVGRMDNHGAAAVALDAGGQGAKGRDGRPAPRFLTFPTTLQPCHGMAGHLRPFPIWRQP